MGTLSDLVTPISTQTDEELLQRIHGWRHRREVSRPAQKSHIKKAVKKKERQEMSKKTKSIEQQLAECTPEQLSLLLKELEK